MIKVKSHYRKRKFVRAHNRKEREERGRKNRDKGLKFEFRALAYAQKNHKVVFRSSGSRGLVDVVVEHPDKMKYWVVKQNGYIPISERNALKNYFKTKPKFVDVELIYRKHNKDMSLKKITPDNLDEFNKILTMPPAREVKIKKYENNIKKKIRSLERTEKKSFSSIPYAQLDNNLMNMVP